MEFTIVPRFKVSDTDEIRTLVQRQRPFVIEEGGNEAFQAFAEWCTAERIAALFGDRPWRVQDFDRGPFDPYVPPVERTSVMPFSQFMEKYEHPDEGHQNYVNVWPSEDAEFAAPLFEKMRALGRALPLTSFADQDLKTIWLGGAGTTSPLHYDTYARSHGTVYGMKQYIFWPPDSFHFKRLGGYSVRSACGWWSRIGFGPIDDEVFPELKGTQASIAQCRPGDFVWLPPCWWHHVSIPEGPTISISANHYDWHTYAYWYHWRMRATRWLGRRGRLLDLIQDRSA